MEDYRERVDMAAIALEQLSILHDEFMICVEGSGPTQSMLGVMGIQNNEIKARCLGIDLSVNHRPIIQNGLPSIIEYSFVARWHEENIEIFTFFLFLDRRLSFSQDPAEKIFAINNKYIAKNILYVVSDSLLDSKIFAPKEIG